MVVLLVVLGGVERAGWNLLRPTGGAAGEAMRIAMAIGQGRGFADAYRIGQGPTAHMLPISPGLAGIVYAASGPGSAVSEFILASWSIALAMGTYLLLYRAFAGLGMSRWVRLGGLAFACLAPAYTGAEAVDFRVWDGGLAAFLLALLLDRLVALSARDRVETRHLAVIAVVAAFLFFVNPPLGVAAYGCIGLYALRALPLGRIVAWGAGSVLALAVLILPWSLRNRSVFGETILLRSNAGLELALANYPGAGAGDHKAKFLARLSAIHPSDGEAYDAMQAAGGEVPYARRLQRSTAAWIAANKREFAGLMLLHIRQALVPQRWQFDVFGNTLSPTSRAMITDVVGILGLCGIAAALARRRWMWVYPAVIVAGWALLTSPFQPVTRYTYLIYPLMVFCAADFVGWIIDLARRRRVSAPA